MADERATQTVQAPGDEVLEVPTVLPVLPVRDVIIYPGGTVPLQIGRPGSLAALEEAGHGGFLLIGTQLDPNIEEPTLDELYGMGTIGRVVRVLDAREGGKQALVVGVARARIGPPVSFSPALRVVAHAVNETPIDSPEGEATWRRVVMLAQRVISLREDMPDEWKSFITGIPSGSLLADLIASNIPLTHEDKAELLAEVDPVRRLQSVERHLEREVVIAEKQRSLRVDAESEDTDPARREQMLRERMREIQNEIGDGDSGEREVDELRDRIAEADLPDEARAQAERELKRLAALPQQAPDRHMIRTYLEWMAELPWRESTEDRIHLGEARGILDEDHHGLDKVKERILEFLAVRKLAPDAKAPILCFVGPPGVGKTSLGRSIARTLGRKFARASLGGVRDEAEIRGHRRTYVGSMPGRILQSIRRAGSNNPVFLLDEIDKLGADFRGDPSSALLEVLDPEQNHAFSDHYLDVDFDLSKVLFIATANTLSTIPPALLDRMEVLELPGYTERDKQAIARDFLVPKQREAHGLGDEHVDVTGEAIDRVVEEYTREAGVRNLERHIASLMRKVARKIAEQGSAAQAQAAPKAPIVVDAEFVADALGAPPHLPETAERTEIPGVAVGLAATTHGGDILFIESTRSQGGKGIRLRTTGQLGDVMKESSEAALSWVRSNADDLGLEETSLSPGEIHLHVPAGAVPKDGPSAGVAVVTSLVSLLSGRRARGNVAATGEMSLRGRVLPVGGIKAKLMAAQRAGIDTVVIPARNRKDLVEVPEEVRDALDIRPVHTIEEALAVTLDPPAAV